MHHILTDFGFSEQEADDFLNRCIRSDRDQFEAVVKHISENYPVSKKEAEKHIEKRIAEKS